MALSEKNGHSAGEPVEIVNQAIFAKRVGEIMAVAGQWPVDLCIVIFAQVLGQLVAVKARNVPGKIQEHVDRCALGIKAAALQRMIHDDNERREQAKVK